MVVKQAPCRVIGYIRCVFNRKFQGGIMRHGCVLLLFLVPGLSAGADIYRCSGEQGEPAFSQRPCGSDSTPVLELRSPPGGPATGLRASEQAWLADRDRAAQARRDRGRNVGSDAGRRAQAVARQAYQCRRKHHDLDTVKAQLRRGYKPAAGERLRRRRRAYEDYLSAFCP